MNDEVPLSELVALRATKISTGKDPSKPYLGLEHLGTDCSGVLGSVDASASVSVNSVFTTGDILFGKLRPNLRKCVQVDFNGYCSTDILVFVARPGTDPGFAARTLQSERVFSEALRMAEGTKMPRTSWNALSGLCVRRPPITEQCRIADALNSVDDAIRFTERVIAKLEQIKQGLVHDLLTRGLDDDGQLRTFADTAPVSATAGQCPRQWTLAPLGERIVSIDAGHSPDVPDVRAAHGQWAVLKVSAVKPEGFQPSENKALLDQRNVKAALEIRGGDLLMTRANTPQLVGLACVVSETPRRLLLSDKTLRLNLDDRRAVPRFVALALQSPLARRQIEINGTGSSGSMKNISQQDIREIVLAWPSPSEQGRIVERVEAASRQLQSSRKDLSKLRKVKLGLMGDLLKGRVHVHVDSEATT